MEMYIATVEVELRRSGDVASDVLVKLKAYHPAIGHSPRGWAWATISLPADSLAQACVTAAAVVQSAFGMPAIACQVLTEKEFLARQGPQPGR